MPDPDSTSSTPVAPKPSRRSFLKYAIAAAAVAGAASVGGSAYYKYVYLPSQAPTSFGLGYSHSLTTDSTLIAGQQQNYFANNKLAPNFVPFSDLATAMNSFVSGAFQFHWDANIPSSANARAQGRDVVAISNATIASNAILVKKDSPYQTVADLKGKSVGTFLLPSLSFIIASEVYNKNNPNSTISPLTDFKYSQGAPPILNQNLLSGQLEAVETIEPYVSLGVVSGARVLTGAYDAWKSLTGGTILGAVVGAQGSYASANPDVAKGVIQSWEQGRNYVLNNADFFNNYVKTTYNYTDQSLIDTLRANVYKTLAPLDWNDSFIANLNQFLQLLQKYNIVSNPPSDLFTTKYHP